MKGSFENKTLGIIAKRTKSFASYPPMFHAHSEIVYVISGNVTVTIDGMRKTIGKGEMSVCFPYSIHSYEKADNAEVLFVLFSAEYVAEFGQKILLSKPNNPYMEGTEKFEMLLGKVLEYSNRDDDDAKRCTKAYLSAVVGEIFMNMKMERTDNADIDTVRRILLYCAEHYRENIDIKSVAENTFVSRRYVTKIFSEKIGLPFRKHINMLRTAEAKKLMENSSMRIIDVMYECGFCNQSSFNRIFFDETGMTPREYKKSVRGTCIPDAVNV